jgi:hypothetical protein
MSVGIESVTSAYWDIFSPTTMDNSTTSWVVKANRPNNFPNNSLLSTQTTASLDIPITEQDSFCLPSQAYLQMVCKVVDTTQNPAVPYPAGTPVALENDFASSFMNRFELFYNGEPLEQTNNFQDIANFTRTTLEYSYDYASQNQGQTDLVVYSAANMDQTTGLAQTQSRFIFNSVGTGTFNPTFGGNVFLPQVSPTGTSPTSATGSGGGGALFIGATGLYNGAVCPVLFMNDFISPTSGTGAQAYNSAFWTRQAISDNGKVFMLNVPLNRISSFCAGYKRVLVGSNLLFRFYLNTQSSRLWQCGATLGSSVAPGLQVLDVQLQMPFLKPDLPVRAKIIEQLAADRSQILLYRNWLATPALGWASGTTSYNQSLTVNAENVDWLIMAFIPTTYLTSYTNSSKVSYLPPLNSSNGLPFSSAFVQVGGQTYPSSPYGTFPSDLARMWETFQYASGRENYEDLQGVVNFQQWLYSYGFLCFDLTKKEPGSITNGSSIQINLTAYNAYTQNMTPFLIYVSEKKLTITSASGKLLLVSQ